MSDNLQQRVQGSSAAAPKRRLDSRQASSCTECRRRKQKCSQGQPCTNCARRFPQPACEYEIRSTTKSRNASSRSLEKRDDIAIFGKGDTYAHLNFDGMQDAILEIESTTSPDDGPELDENDQFIPIMYHDSSGYSSQETNTPIDSDQFVGHYRNWLPFRLVVRDHYGRPIRMTLQTALKAIIGSKQRFARISAEDECMVDASTLIQAVQGNQGPSQALVSVESEMTKLPMAPTKLNKELARTYLRLLSRFKANVSGTPEADNPLMKRWIPFMVQDPLLMKIVLFTSACFLNEIGFLPKTVVIALRGIIYQALNDHLASKKDQVNDAAILAVSEMVLDEWYWGATHELHAHLKGLKVMITMRGGLQNLGMHGYLTKMILIHDICMAISHETVPEIYGVPGFEYEDSIMMPFQLSFNSPLIFNWPSFASCTASLYLHPCTSIILDDVRTMIHAIVMLPDDATPEQTAEATAVAQWVLNRIGELPENVPLRQVHSVKKQSSDGLTEATSPFNTQGSSTGSSSERGTENTEASNQSKRAGSRQHDQSSSPTKTETIERGSPPMESHDRMYSMVRLTALIYCRAIIGRAPTSMVCTDKEFMELWLLVWRVPVPARRTIVGIYIWVLLAIAPSCHSKAPARFVRTLIVNSLLTIAVQSWHLSIEAADSALKLQKWLKGSTPTRGLVFGGERMIEKHGFAQKEVLNNISTVHQPLDRRDDDEDEEDEDQTMQEF